MSRYNPIALYVHWPFCKAKCPYCDFNSHVREGVDADAWREALLQELRFIASMMGPRRVTSVFFGGGTPSLMEPETIEAILKEAHTLWGLDKDCEITLEANPTSVEAQKFFDFKLAGINRVSIGVQSLVDADLKALGRMHSVDEAKNAIALAIQFFTRYSFDLIYARPNQTPAQWEEELAEALSMTGGHLSVYQLTIEPGTQFHTLYHSGRLVLPSEDDAAKFYDITQDMLEDAGLPAYEISNHAWPGFESRHNLTYWRYGEYVGIGPGAHGRVDIDGARYATRTHRAPEEWLKRVAEGGHGYHPFEAVDIRAQFEEKLMMGLRLREGVALQDTKTEWLNASKIKLLQSEDLLEQSDTHLVPTRRGKLVLTSLNAALLAEDSVEAYSPEMTDAVQPVAAQGRYSITDDGQIFFQENATNPLAGVAIGRIEKGDALLAPKAVAEGHETIQEWLDIHVRQLLEPLFKLKQSEGEGALIGAALAIGERLYDQLGVMPRADLEDLIVGLDADTRKLLRGKGVRMGPVLVFLPALVKPAAIKMRALLWGLWNDKTLPVSKPADGRVSEVVDAAAIDQNFYRMIGYPVFGPRAIRIDMVDRVVTDIYEAADKGVFEAKHKYAEWFGCGLEDLYAVLEVLGHRRLNSEIVTPHPDPLPEGEGIIAPVVKVPPPLVKFMLKRGKLSEQSQPKPQRKRHSGESRSPEKQPDKKIEELDSGVRRNDKEEKKKFTPKKRYDPNAPQQKKERERDGDDKPRRKNFDRDRDQDRNREAKVYTFEGKKQDADDSNPFAILKNLKT